MRLVCPTSYATASANSPAAKLLGNPPMRSWQADPLCTARAQLCSFLGAVQERAMMSEIYRRGPITCGIATPVDFTYGYHGGVYHDPKNYTRDSVDHDVEVVGWGEEAGQPVWIVRNSWGTFWGELGFFKLPRGINSLFIEDGDCWCADFHRSSCVLFLACMPILACLSPLPSSSFRTHPLSSSYNVTALQGTYLRSLCCSHVLIKVSLKMGVAQGTHTPKAQGTCRLKAQGHGWILGWYC